jgi:hypothetical protein
MQLQIDRRPDGRIIIEIPGNDGAAPAATPVHTSALQLFGAAYQGGLYAGLTIDDNAPAELILLPGEFNGNWKDAGAWAKDQGGVLPSRVDALILLHNLPGEFRKEAYWTATQPAAGPDYAWYQGFSYGYQSDSHIDIKLRARAVRRLII